MLKHQVYNYLDSDTVLSTFAVISHCNSPRGGGNQNQILVIPKECHIFVQSLKLNLKSILVFSVDKKGVIVQTAMDLTVVAICFCHWVDFTYVISCYRTEGKHNICHLSPA